MIVILDTNVWVSALHFAKVGGTTTKALEKATTRDQLATCWEIDAEIYRTLTEKFSWDTDRALGALRVGMARALSVEIQGTVHRCRDPKDDIFLECAERANADLLVAGDKDLLVLASHKQTRIVTPAQYLAIEP